uniref:Uncharacterized protein n=1 Tax=Fibrocapsa japonica TaxID=94617 RepID=A0A7S2V3N2_9STRA|mmetsp:Transcript_2592/g.3806  ORF Transcript_2592/g.3806 Transcript_2592/m.3806 type:complete len:150 (+) Transcript_2592:30-479(+)
MVSRVIILFSLLSTCKAFLAPHIDWKIPRGCSFLKAHNNDALEAAREAALRATATFGVHSVQAKLEWETFEDIASAGTFAATLPALDEQCFSHLQCQEYEAASLELSELIGQELDESAVAALVAENKQLQLENSKLIHRCFQISALTFL